jgi:hypothetical protein
MIEPSPVPLLVVSGDAALERAAPVLRRLL